MLSAKEDLLVLSSIKKVRSIGYKDILDPYKPDSQSPFFMTYLFSRVSLKNIITFSLKIFLLKHKRVPKFIK